MSISNEHNESPTMVATMTSDSSSKAEIWEIINTGRLFLRALERFALEKFPEDDSCYRQQQHDKIAMNEPKIRKESVASPPLAVGAAAKRQVSNNIHGQQNQREHRQFANIEHASSKEKVASPSPSPTTAVPKRPEAESTTTEIDVPSKRQKIELEKGAYRKGVVLYDAKTNEMKGRFESAADAARFLLAANPDKSFKTIESGISGVLTGKQKSCVGYTYRNVGADGELLPIPVLSKQKPSTGVRRYRGTVLQYCSETGNIQNRYDSASKAAEAYVKVNPDNKLMTVSKGISRVLRGERLTYGNSVYRYDDDASPLPNFPIAPKVRTPSGRSLVESASNADRTTLQEKQQDPNKNNYTEDWNLKDSAADNGDKWNDDGFGGANGASHRNDDETSPPPAVSHGRDDEDSKLVSSSGLDGLFGTTEAAVSAASKMSSPVASDDVSKENSSDDDADGGDDNDRGQSYGRFITI